MPWSEGMTREEYEAEVAALAGENEALAARVQALTAQVSQGEMRQAAVRALLAAGVKPERLEKALGQLPEGADCSTPEKATAAVNAVKAELPEWFGAVPPNGVGRSPSETPPPTDLARLSMPEYIAARKRMAG